MKKTFIAVALAFTAVSFSVPAAVNYTAGEQVWEAVRTNTQRTCGIGFTDGSPQVGTILASGEQANDGGSVRFSYKTNANNISWKITEAKIVDMTNRFSFGDDLYNGNVDKKDSSLFASVNNAGYNEFSWNDVKGDRNFPTRQGTINLQPKINVASEDFPLGTTKIQGKIVVTCSN